MTPIEPELPADGSGRVVIVGAGVAGLVAADALVDRFSETGKTPEIVILEAAPVCGGRVRDVTVGGQVANEGANWFHHGEKNAFYIYLQKKRAPLKPTDHDNVTSIVAVTPKGTEYSRFYLGGLYWLGLTLTAVVGLALRYAIFKLFNRGDVAIGRLARWSTSNEMKVFFDYNARYWAAVNSSDALSTQEAITTMPQPGGIQLKLGNGAVIGFLEGSLKPRVTFSENALVKKITQMPSGEIEIDFDKKENGTIKAYKVKCTKCIVTASIGVLQSHDIQFDALVRQQLDSKLADLTMGHMCKIVVSVPASVLARFSSNTFVLNRTSGSEGFMHVKTAGKPLVTVFLGGAQAVHIEHQPDHAAQLVREQFAAVRALRQVKVIASQIHVTQWSRNERVRGAYSALNVGGARVDPFAINDIIFCGEAFVADPKKSPGMMIGAYHSGLMASELASR